MKGTVIQSLYFWCCVLFTDVGVPDCLLVCLVPDLEVEVFFGGVLHPVPAKAVGLQAGSSGFGLGCSLGACRVCLKRQPTKTKQQYTDVYADLFVVECKITLGV